jgi:hypothetical protein
MLKIDLVPGTALAALTFSLTMLALLSSKGVVSEEEARGVHAVVLAALEEARTTFGDGPVEIALSLISSKTFRSSRGETSLRAYTGSSSIRPLTLPLRWRVAGGRPSALAGGGNGRIGEQGTGRSMRYERQRLAGVVDPQSLRQARA